MATFQVNQATDNGLGDTTGSLSWAIKQANQSSGNDIIELTTDVRLQLAPELKRMDVLINSNVEIRGNGYRISGDNDNDGIVDLNGEDRPLLFIKSGDVALKNLTLANGVAQGGNSNRGGGGAGMGGALLIYSGNVTAQNVTFDNNRAVGGSSKIATAGDGGGGIGAWGINAAGGGLWNNNNLAADGTPQGQNGQTDGQGGGRGIGQNNTQPNSPFDPFGKEVFGGYGFGGFGAFGGGGGYGRGGSGTGGNDFNGTGVAGYGGKGYGGFEGIKEKVNQGP